jgi:hypothetical protein
MFGRELSFPLELITGIPQIEKQFTPQNYAQEIKTNLINAFEIARKNIGAAHKRQKQYFNDHSYTIPIKVDDLVFLRNFVKKPFQSGWTGPFKVLRVIAEKVLEIIPIDGSTGRKLQTVSIDNVKKVSIQLQNKIAQEQRMALLHNPEIRELDAENQSESSDDEVNFQTLRPLRQRINHRNIDRENLRVIPDPPENFDIPENENEIHPPIARHNLLPDPPVQAEQPQRLRPERIRGAPRHLVDYYVNTLNDPNRPQMKNISTQTMLPSISKDNVIVPTKIPTPKPRKLKKKVIIQTPLVNNHSSSPEEEESDYESSKENMSDSSSSDGTTPDICIIPQVNFRQSEQNVSAAQTHSLPFLKSENPNSNENLTSKNQTVKTQEKYRKSSTTPTSILNQNEVQWKCIAKLLEV